MNRSGTEPSADSIRSSIHALSATSRSARAELDHVEDLIRASVEQIARTAASVPVRPASSDLDTSILQAGSDMARVLGQTQEHVASLITAETDELEALLRRAGPDPVSPTAHAGPGNGPGSAGVEPPPLPSLDDIEAQRGTAEWAAAVVERYPRLTTDEVLAIYHYTTVKGVEEVNGYLRHPERTPEADREAVQKLIDNTASGLAKLPKQPAITYRGTNLPAEVLEQWQPGARVADRGFMSTSAEAFVAEKFRRAWAGNAFITVSGASGVDIEPLSYFGWEAEILFQPSQEFRVMSRTWDDDRGCWEFEIIEVAR